MPPRFFTTGWGPVAGSVTQAGYPPSPDGSGHPFDCGLDSLSALPQPAAQTRKLFARHRGKGSPASSSLYHKPHRPLQPHCPHWRGSVPVGQPTTLPAKPDRGAINRQVDRPARPSIGDLNRDPSPDAGTIWTSPEQHLQRQASLDCPIPKRRRMARSLFWAPVSSVRRQNRDKRNLAVSAGKNVAVPAENECL